MIEKIQKIKSVFINNLKKKDNGTLAKVGDYVHQECQVLCEYYFKKIPVPSVADILNENDIDDENQEIEHLDIIANEPLDFIENDPSDLNENENEVTAHPQAIPVEKLEVKLNKSCSTHKKCFVCRNENDYTKLVSITPAAAFDVLAKCDIYVVKGSRCCNSHLDEKGFLSQDSIQYIKQCWYNYSCYSSTRVVFIRVLEYSRVKNKFLLH